MASRTNHSVDRALSLLRLLARAHRPVRFADIQAQSGIPKGTLHSLLASLEAAEFARRSAQGYEIGLAAFEVGTAVRVPASLRAAVAPLLDEQSSLGEACHFGMLDGGDVVYLDRRDYSHDALHYTLPVGSRKPAYSTALGKAMLALQPDAEIEALYPGRLPMLTPRTLTSRAELLAVLAGIRDRGYATESEEFDPWCLLHRGGRPAPRRQLRPEHHRARGAHAGAGTGGQVPARASGGAAPPDRRADHSRMVRAGGAHCARGRGGSDMTSAPFQADAQEGRLDVVHANGGLESVQKATDASVQHRERVLNVNLTSVFLVCLAAQRHMYQRGAGSVVITSSLHATATVPEAAAYAASGGVYALMHALALEVAPHGVGVNAVNPRVIGTPMLRGEMLAAAELEAQLSKLAASHPLGRLGQPWEVAAVVLFLASEAASFSPAQRSLSTAA